MKTKLINGYRALYLPEHPHSKKSPKMFGWVYEHRISAEDMLGRALRDDEEVHHLDENKLNNHPDNLLVLPGTQHVKLHAWLRRLGIDPKKYPTRLCFCCGSVLSNSTEKYCNPICSAKGRRTVERPDKEQLEIDIELLSLVKVGVKYGVSDNAIRKWCRQYGIIIPKRFIRATASSNLSVLVPTQ